jgi:hypothetical protein
MSKFIDIWTSLNPLFLSQAGPDIFSYFARTLGCYLENLNDLLSELKALGRLHIPLIRLRPQARRKQGLLTSAIPPRIGM